MNKSKSFLLPLIIVGALFFILGFITWLNGMLIPYLKTSCELTNFQALFVTFSFYISYTLMALPSSFVLEKIGFRNGMSVGLWVMSVGALVFIPAAYTREYLYFLVGLFILGSGMALLQTAVNPYITILGPIESAAKRISIMGVANKVAGAMAPLILAFFIIKDGDDEIIKTISALSLEAKSTFLDELALRVINPYIVMAVVLFLVGLLIRYTHLPKVSNTSESDTEIENETHKTTIWQFPHLWLGVTSLFLYVGVEVIAGDTIIQYGQSMGVPLSEAKIFTSFTMVAMLIGYFIGIILIPKYLSQHKALQYSAILGIVFSLAAIFTPGVGSVVFVALLGLANALVWPSIWPLAIDGLGKFINKGSAFLIMAISGGAILPLLWGKLSDDYNSQLAYWVMPPAYLLIYLYSVKGYKLRRKKL